MISWRKEYSNRGVMLTSNLHCEITPRVIVTEVSTRTRDFAELRHDLNITRSRGLSRAHPGEKQTRSHAGTLADSAYFRKRRKTNCTNI